MLVNEVMVYWHLAASGNCPMLQMKVDDGGGFFVAWFSQKDIWCRCVHQLD